MNQSFLSSISCKKQITVWWAFPNMINGFSFKTNAANWKINFNANFYLFFIITTRCCIILSYNYENQLWEILLLKFSWNPIPSHNFEQFFHKKSMRLFMHDPNHTFKNRSILIKFNISTALDRTDRRTSTQFKVQFSWLQSHQTDTIILLTLQEAPKKSQIKIQKKVCKNNPKFLPKVRFLSVQMKIVENIAIANNKCGTGNTVDLKKILFKILHHEIYWIFEPLLDGANIKDDIQKLRKVWNEMGWAWSLILISIIKK